ncbi:unnamed protein product, partial [Ixodes hexagonus]
DTRVRFILGPSLYGKRPTLYINLPLQPNVEFERDRYHEVPWSHDVHNPNDETAYFSNVTFSTPGSFHYYFLCDDDVPPNNSGSGYFLVDPVLTYGDGEELPLDCVQCQTVLAKGLGPLDSWLPKLQVARETGYNFVHLSPIQELGNSLSSYSIRDHRKLNPMFSPSGKPHTMEDVAKIINTMCKEWKVLSMTDVVLNHVANETPWIREHPECTYNLKNSPHLKPAFLLDVVLHCFTLEIAEGKWEAEGVPPTITKEEHLEAVRRILNLHWLPLLQLHEFYTINVDALVDTFHQKVIDFGAPTSEPLPEKPLKVLHHPEFLRNGSTVDMDIALRIFNRNWEPDSPDAPHQIGRCCGELRRCLEKLNGNQWGLLHGHLQAAVENVIKGCRYLRLQHDGPKKQTVSRKNPLVGRYFVVLTNVPKLDLKQAEKLMFSDGAAFVMAHNGWVMNDNPLRNFAEPGSNIYLRRELIAWADSVKLRYGNSPKDCPFLWDYMREYVCESARLFHGLRLDNCHSTPLPLAEYVLDAARKVRPDLYVIAELFTSREEVDNLFVNRLGINSLIREAMTAPDARELGRLIYRFGGEPVGSFLAPPIRPLTPSMAHALFMDMTHDNPSPFEKRSPYDVLPTAAIVSMACCGTGSSRGYDEMVPHHIHVVEESRQFPAWSAAPVDGTPTVHPATGIVAAKRVLNRMHLEMGLQGYRHIYVDQVDANIVSITRHCFETHQSVVLVARTSFHMPSNPKETGCIPPLCIPGTIDEIIFEARCLPVKNAAPFQKDKDLITGSTGFRLDIREHISLYESKMVELSDASEAHIQELDFCKFPPGSVIAFKVSPYVTAKAAVQQIRHHLAAFGYAHFEEVAPPADSEESLASIAAALTLSDLNRVLFRADCEERAEGRNCGAYSFHRFGTLVYCGLQGLMSVLSEVRSKNDLGHPMCDNLRAGDWLMDYIVARLAQERSTLELSRWFEKVFAWVRLAPRYLIPCYFDAAVTSCYSVLLEETWQKMSDFVKHGSTLVRELALGSVILGGFVPGAHLPPLSKHLALPLPPHRMRGDSREEACTTLAAGEAVRRSGGGRSTTYDTSGSVMSFVAASGPFLAHGRYTTVHTPGTHARYNCRDAVWWWLQAIQDYCKEVPQGYLLLKDRVARLYPTDDSPPLEPGVKEMPLEEVIQEAIQRHFEGISFRERNAGYQIDSQMSHHGFNVEAGIDLKTGFVQGGNIHNCGTWMDKMGSSEKAGNKGHAATPRQGDCTTKENGSAVELVGLCKSTLRWLDQMYKEGFYPYNAVEKTEHGVKTVMTFDQWGSLIKKHFEECFWVRPANEPTSPDDLNPQLANRRCIYKDCYGASPPWTDYQLRPNFPIAMVVAPELFTAKRAWQALNIVREVLVGPYGMKTLDPSDLNYNGYYNNSNDSNDFKVARGFNYHQGPEWLWPMGYYLRARLYFARKVDDSEDALKEVVAEVKEVLANICQLIQASPWRGLPELTNCNGDHCPDSCPIQAWSHASLLEVLYELQKI